ncbi:MAG: hypothetical protein WC152_03500 [Candidatus Izemoplasmatales bacterium]
MANTEIKQFAITQLLLNSTNPRFDPVQHQVETIEAMLKDQGDKLVVLAKHIVANGLNPAELIIVQPKDNNQWVIREGNRRITALKILNQPTLIPDAYAKIKRDIKDLSNSTNNDLFKNINCVVINDEKVINEWIRLKHTGQNEGAGVVSWDTLQSSRFQAQVSGKPDAKMLFYELLSSLFEIPIKIRENFSNIKKTNFDRLIGDPCIRHLLCIDYSNGEYSLNKGVNEFLLEVLKDLAITDISVGKIYSKKDRQKYIEELRARISTKQKDAPKENEETKYTDESISGNGHAKTEQERISSQSDNTSDGTQSLNLSNQINNSSSRSYPIKRKTLIPSQHKLTIGHARILKIFNELKTLDVATYPNSTAFTFRVFMELSGDYYISYKSLQNVSVDSKFTQKIDAIANYFETNAIMTKHELRAARQMGSSQTQNNSIKTFHSYIHNKDVTPIADDLKTAWDDLWTFIENIWR